MQPEKRTSSRTTVSATKKGAPSSAKAGETNKVAGADNAASRTSIITEKERRGLIAQAAYLAAARRSFLGGSPEKDWLEAEAEIDARLLHLRGGNA